MIQKKNGSFINGRTIIKGYKTIQLISPLGFHISSIEIASKRDLDSAVVDAKSAFSIWSKTTIKDRVKIFFKYISLLETKKNEIAELIHQENGKLINEAILEIEESIDLVKFACSLPQLVANEDYVSADNVEYCVVRKPVGIVASIVAFNYPFMLPHFTIANSLVLGNCMILKPSLKTPLSSLYIAKLLQKAGLPNGVLNVLITENETTNDFCEHPNIDAITFIGSSKVAKLIYQRATHHLKRCVSLGGSKHHTIVFPDASSEIVASEIVNSMAICAGQRCLSPSVLVAVGNIDHIIEKIIVKAKYFVPGENLGSIITPASKVRIIEFINEAETSGANLLVDGRMAGESLKGNYLGITILDNIETGSKVATEEIFGPVLSIIRVNNIDDAIHVANSSKFGNATSIFTQNEDNIVSVLSRIEAGMIGVNKCIPSHKHLFSYGGMKESKFGACDINGKSSIEFWTRLQKSYRALDV
jgi:malonate-semialdehyde dehydrogenase (acetylating)/methylmalonate-semialdehyde dehydrogenase